MNPEIPAQVPRRISDWGDLRSPLRGRAVAIAVSSALILLAVAAIAASTLTVEGEPFYGAIGVACGVLGLTVAWWLRALRAFSLRREVCEWGLIVSGRVDTRSPGERPELELHYQALSGEVRHVRMRVEDERAEGLRSGDGIEVLVDPERSGLACIPRLQGVRFDPVEDHRPESFDRAPEMRATVDLEAPLHFELFVRPSIHASNASLEVLGELRLDAKGLWLKRVQGGSSTRFVAWDVMGVPELSAWLLTPEHAELNVSLAATGQPYDQELRFGTRLPQSALLRSLPLVQDAVPYMRPDDFRLIWPVIQEQLERRADELELPERSRIRLDEYA